MLQILAALIAVGVVMLTAGVIVGVHLVRRRVRLVKGPPVPWRWVFSTSQAARLHRRLRRVDVSAASLVPRQRRLQRVVLLPSQEMAGDVRSAARALDAHLVAAANVETRVRRAQLEMLDRGVRDLERSVLQLHRVSGTPSGASDWQNCAERVGLFSDAFHHLTPN